MILQYHMLQTLDSYPTHLDEVVCWHPSATVPNCYMMMKKKMLFLILQWCLLHCFYHNLIYDKRISNRMVAVWSLSERRSTKAEVCRYCSVDCVLVSWKRVTNNDNIETKKYSRHTDNFLPLLRINLTYPMTLLFHRTQEQFHWDIGVSLSSWWSSWWSYSLVCSKLTTCFAANISLADFEFRIYATFHTYVVLIDKATQYGYVAQTKDKTKTQRKIKDIAFSMPSCQ